MIRRTLRFGIRLGLLAGIGLALFKVLQGRRSASEFGSPSPDWAPPPTPNPNLPKSPPEPELIKPAMLEEVIEKKAAVRAAPDSASPDIATRGVVPTPPPRTAAQTGATALPSDAPAEKASPAKRDATKKAAPADPAAAGPVKKVAPPKKAAARKVAPPIDVPPAGEAALARKAAPAKKAPKKTQP